MSKPVAPGTSPAFRHRRRPMTAVVRPRRRRQLAVTVAATLAATALVASALGEPSAQGGRGGVAAAAGTTTGPATSGPPAIPAHGAYVGAFVAPHLNEGNAQANIRYEAADLPNFEAEIGRPLGLIHVYQAWGSPVSNSALATLSATGSTPLIDWTCTSTATILSGADDTTIEAYAHQLKTFGHPVFLRWFWEMNLVREPRTASCLGSLGASGYVGAWQHIVNIFRADGATNVAFVWCPSVLDTTFGVSFYPGSAYVDWIGVDGYDRTQNGSVISLRFQPFYNHWSPTGKPMMIGETGATTDQASYLAALATVLPTTFPDIKAVNYYDSTSNSDWSLSSSPGNDGLDAFAALAQTTYFSYPYIGS